MTLTIHLILTALATMFGWDVARRLSPVGVPGVVARVLIAVLGVVLWILCPVNILVGMAIAGTLMLVGQLAAVEPHWEWGKTLRDMLLIRRQMRGQQVLNSSLEKKTTRQGLKSFQVKEQVGRRISKL